MRFIAWNCNERFGRNYLHLRDLDFDVAVVTECGPFEPGLGEVREVSSVLKLAVDQPRHTKHIGVLAREPWHVEPLPLVSSQPWLLPVRVTGPIDFTILAVWALGPEWVEHRLSYARQTARVITEVLPACEGPVVLAGDLNAPIASNPSGARQHADNVSRLTTHGLVSAFTAARGDADPLTEPTLYHQRRPDQPFHIDHIFIPKDWTSGIKLTVGSYAEWVSTKRSDHVPVTTELLLPGIAATTPPTV